MFSKAGQKWEKKIEGGFEVFEMERNYGEAFCSFTGKL